VGSGTTLQYSDVSDIGLRRHKNQDSHAVLAPWSREQFRRTGWLFVVADGMGAHAAGETASDLAAKTVPQAYQRLAARSPPLALVSSIRQANDLIHQQGEASAELRGMGTTCTALAILPRGALVGHVGDSRAYRIRGQTIEQFTRDHSLAWEVEERGGSPTATPKNIITRSLGPHPNVLIDWEGPFDVEEGDTFVVCSDGLSGQVADEEIGLVAGSLAPADAVATLLGLALVRGAPDNVTVIVARAGRHEATDHKPGDPPWSLSEEAPEPQAAQPLPVKSLALAAGGLLGGLIAASLTSTAGWDAVRKGQWPASGQDGLALLLLGGLGLVFVAAIAFALARLLSSGTAASLVLPPGKRLGGGPYRSFSCQPSPALLDGIIASLDSAAEGVDEAAGESYLAEVAVARAAAARGDVPEALAAVQRGLARYRQAVEAGRQQQPPAND
jgi:protein phosphatase